MALLGGGARGKTGDGGGARGKTGDGAISTGVFLVKTLLISSRL